MNLKMSKVKTTKIGARGMKQPSTILQQVIADMRVREERGLMKYGTTVDRTDLTLEVS